MTAMSTKYFILQDMGDDFVDPICEPYHWVAPTLRMCELKSTNPDAVMKEVSALPGTLPIGTRIYAAGDLVKWRLFVQFETLNESHSAFRPIADDDKDPYAYMYSLKDRGFSHIGSTTHHRYTIGIPASKLARDSFVYAINMYRRSLWDYGGYQTILCKAISSAAKGFKAFDIRASLMTGSLWCQAYAKLGIVSAPESRGLFESFVYAVIGEYKAALFQHRMTDIPRIADQLRDSIGRTYDAPSHRESMVGFIHNWSQLVNDMADPNKVENATPTFFINTAMASGWYYDSEGHQII